MSMTGRARSALVLFVCLCLCPRPLSSFGVEENDGKRTRGEDGALPRRDFGRRKGEAFEITTFRWAWTAEEVDSSLWVFGLVRVVP